MPLRYHMPLFRPPSEGDNLIIQATLGCSFNRCSFCSMYRTKTYGARPFDAVAADIAAAARAWDITWRPDKLSASFHGRDLFAPVAAEVAANGTFAGPPKGREIAVQEADRPDWPDELEGIVYVDGFGNAISGIRAENLSPNHRIVVHNVEIKGEKTFASVPPGTLFWYANSSGLVEIACNRGRADRRLGLSVGTGVRVVGNQPVTVVT